MEARQKKLLHTYGTNEVQMSVQNIRLGDDSCSPVRMSNTFRSTLQFGSHESIFPKNSANKSSHSSINHQPTRTSSAQPRKLSRHNYNSATFSNLLASSPQQSLHHPIVRASFQDSNIFGTKDPSNATVQKSARYFSTQPLKQSRNYGNMSLRSRNRQLIEEQQRGINGFKSEVQEMQGQSRHNYRNQSEANQRNNNAQQQGWEGNVDIIAYRKRLRDRANSISDCKKVLLTGSTTRVEKNWKSNVFGEPIQYKPKRKLLGRPTVGVEGFGFSQPTDQNSKRFNDFAHSFKRSQSTYSQDLRGKQSQLHSIPTHRKRFQMEDMISAGADWSNPSHQPIQNRKNQELGVIVERRGRKQRANDSHMNNIGMSKINHMALQREREGDVDQSMKIVSNAYWYSNEANIKPSNIGNISAFQKKMKDMSSSILNQTDYSAYAKLSSKQIDAEQVRRGKVNNSNQMFSDIGINGAGRSKSYWVDEEQNASKNYHKKQPSFISANQSFLSHHNNNMSIENGSYDGQGQKQKHLSSVMDQHGYQPDQVGQSKKKNANQDFIQEREPTNYETSSKMALFPNSTNHINRSREVKQQQLSSVLGCGESSLNHGISTANSEHSRTVELFLSEIPENTDDIKMKKISGARHIVETKLMQDTLKGTLTGEGHMKIRLQQGETADQIQHNLEKSGIGVKMKNIGTSRKSIMTQKDLIEMRVIANEVRKMFPGTVSKKKRAKF